MQPTHLKIHSALQPDDAKYSLDYRQPRNHEGKNRRLGVATYIFGGCALAAALVDRSVFPERTLFTRVKYDSAIIDILNFHSLTGVDYGKAKSSNFASITDFLSANPVDFFTCDANEPKCDSLDKDKIEFFDNRDKGFNAGLLFGKNKVHLLDDAFKSYILENNISATDDTLAISHIVSKKYNRRYDHIYYDTKWKVDCVQYPYENSITATSDHSAVIGDFTLLK